MSLQLRCVLCDAQVEIEEESLLAKRAREEGDAFVYVCTECQRRLVERYGPPRERVNPLLGDDRWFKRTFF